MKDDLDVVTAAITAHPFALNLVSTNRKNDCHVVMMAVSINGTAFKFASDELRGNKALVLKAIETNPHTALTRSKNKLYIDPDVLLAIAKQDATVLFYVPSRHWNDNDLIVLAAVSNTAYILRYVSQRLQNDYDVVMAAVTEDGTTLQYASTALRSTKSIVLVATKQRRVALKYALGGLNQDEDCLIAAGLWDEEQKRKSAANTSYLVSSLNIVNHRKIVLSTRFSLSEESSTTATQFTLQFKNHPYIMQQEFNIYSPNAYGKSTCDPNWTDLNWPCRGTVETCQMIDTSNGDDYGTPQQTAKPKPMPTNDSCWRYSFRYQLEQAKRTNGFMLQIVELRKVENDESNINCGDGNADDDEDCTSTSTTSLCHCLGQGQEIERVMAQQVGTKVFCIYQPFIHLKSKEKDEASAPSTATTKTRHGSASSTVYSRRRFLPNDIAPLIRKIQEWYNDDDDGNGMISNTAAAHAVVDVFCPRPIGEE